MKELWAALLPVCLALASLLDGGRAASFKGQRSRLFYHLNGSECVSSRTEDIQLTETDGTSTTVRLQLVESSKDFLPSEFEIDPAVGSMPARPCYYQGVVLATREMATAKLVEGMFSVTFSYNGRMYHVWPRPQQQRQQQRGRSQPQLAPLAAAALPPAPKRKCGAHHHFGGAKANKTRGNGGSKSQGNNNNRNATNDRTITHRRAKRSVLRADTNALVLPENRKYIRLILVSDAGFYNGLGKSVTKTSDRLWEIANLVNGLYKQLGVNVITVKTVVLTSDPFPVNVTAEGVNASELLDQFLTYRMRYLNDTPHTVAHLVSGYPMSGGLVGLANLGKLCYFASGGGVNWDNQINSSAYSIATTVAHELGHNLGMQHDDEDNRTSAGCGCPDRQGCMMQSAGGDSDPVRFSVCSVNYYLEFSVPNGLGYCMTRPPETSVLTAATQICGNRIVEPGEDCDCGLPAYCNNSCCNPATFKFAPGASCASGQCCNTSTCSLMTKGSICRASRGACDLPEYCNGTNEWCPEVDDYLLDGTECATDPASASVLAYCYKGECGSRDARCSQLFTGVVKSATSSAANIVSTYGNETGYCSYQALDAAPLSYLYQGCEASNQRCGLLLCAAPGSAAPTSSWLSMDDEDVRTISLPGVSTPLAYAMLDLTPTGLRDPALVPDGAECGSGMMCVNSVCQTVSSVTAAAGQLPNCNSRGRKAQSRQCFCNPGFAPPDCLTAGNGGSLTNQPAQSASEATTAAAPTVTTAANSNNSPKLDNLAYLGIGIGIGLAAACIIALIVGLTVWACRRHGSGGRGGNYSYGVDQRQPQVATISGGGATNVAYNYSSDQFVSRAGGGGGGGGGGFNAQLAERRV